VKKTTDNTRNPQIYFLFLYIFYLYNNNIFNLIHIYIFIPANGCIGSRLGVLLCLGSYNAVNTALSILAFPTYIWFNVMYLILFSLCVYARLNKLEERGNEIQRYI
jgi:hypothetical protein